MIPIRYLTGDATEPVGPGRKIIAHVCNDVGVWGAGFVLALSKKSSLPEESYRRWQEERLPPDMSVPFHLGEIKIAPFVPDDVFVCNMLAQHGLGAHPKEGIPLRYGALRECLEKLANIARPTSCSVHMPRIGCGLAGGEWSLVERVIQQTLCAMNVEVTVYTPEERKTP